MSVYIYCRTSTAQQKDGLAAQESICRSFLNNLLAQEQWQKRFQGNVSSSGQVLVEVVNEQISGSVAFAKRPRAGELLDKLKKGDHLCLAKLDRAFRSARDCHNTLANLKERGVSTSICDLPDGADVTGNGIAALLIGIMSSVAEWERERIRERTADQKRLAKQQGRYLGGAVPWEMKVVRGTLVLDDKKGSVVKRLRTWRGKSVSLRKCQENVTKLGYDISIATIQRLSDEARSETAKKRGRRARQSPSAS
jgi:DNA invertase Pin-like site-specific DNA recombinase